MHHHRVAASDLGSAPRRHAKSRAYRPLVASFQHPSKPKVASSGPAGRAEQVALVCTAAHSASDTIRSAYCCGPGRRAVAA
jgi:hypothetical protein